jgi:hypothetical protein
LNEVLEAAGNLFLGSSTLTFLTTSAYEIGLEQEPVFLNESSNHVDHSYSYSSRTENPDVKEPEKIQSTPYWNFRTIIALIHDLNQS